MAFSAEQISYAGKSAIDFIMRKKPEDLYNTERPFLKRLQATKKTFPGAKQYINEKLRTTNDSNFQWFGPDGLVSFNRKRTLAEANFAWGSAHDGFALSEEELLQNYISMTDDRNATPTTSEKHQFINLMEENTETLMLGFKEKFDYDLHLDGTQDSEAIGGLDLIISTTPATGTVGGINRATSGNEYWRNQVSLAINTGTAGLLGKTMEQIWRQCTRVGGHAPNFILCGEDFYDAYREDSKDELLRHQLIPQRGGVNMDQSVNSLFFKGIPIQWDPVFDDLQSNLGGSWSKRCYFLNTNFLKLRPAKGQDMIVRRPPRVYNRYTNYWGLTWRGGMTTNNPGSMAVVTIA